MSVSPWGDSLTCVGCFRISYPVTRVSDGLRPLQATSDEDEDASRGPVVPDTRACVSYQFVGAGPQHYVHLGMAAWREAAYSHATALFGFPLVIMKCGQGASARREPSRWLPWPQSGWRLHPRAMRRYPRRPHPRGRGRLHPRAMRPFRFSLRDMSRLFCSIRQRR